MAIAGGRLRELARQRRTYALLRFGGSGVLGVAPIFFWLLVPATPGVSIVIWVGCLGGAVVLYHRGKKLWIMASQAAQGAQGEEVVAQLLKPLERQGWKIEYNLPLRRWGDADAFLVSPKGNYFVIDAKSNRGGVFFDGSVLKRRYGRQVHKFNSGKDLLKAVKGQASSLKDTHKVKFVQPILCFTQANLKEIEQDQDINGVYVVGQENLVKLLKRLDNN